MSLTILFVSCFLCLALKFLFHCVGQAESFVTFWMPHQFNHIDRGLCNQSDSAMMICIMPDSLLCEGFGMPINGKWCVVPWKMAVIHFPPIGKRSPWQTCKLGPKPKIIWHVSHLLPFCKSWEYWSKRQLFFFNVKILIPFRISFCFPGKPLDLQMFCVLVLSSIMISNASKRALPVVNILIMLMKSCDSIGSILQSHVCLVPRAIVLTICRILCTSPWPFLRKVLDRIFTTYLHSGHICLGQKIIVCPIQHLFWFNLRSVLLGFNRKYSTTIAMGTWKAMNFSLNISRAMKTGLSTMEIPCMDPGSPLNAGTSAGLDFVLLWASKPYTTQPLQPLPHVGCQKKRNMCWSLILGWVKWLLKCLSLFTDSRNFKSYQVNPWLHSFSLELEGKILPLLPLRKS